MSIKRLVLVFIGISFAHCMLAVQVYDWPSLLRGLQSEDIAIQVPAQKLLSGTVLPELAKRRPDQLEAEIMEIMRTAEKDEYLRDAAITTISVLQLGLPDSAMAYKPILPSVLALFHDSNPRVRRSAVSVVARLMPDIPEIAIQPFIKALEDSDVGTVDAATIGLARLCKYSAASRAIAKLVQSDQPNSVRIRAILAVGTGKCEDSEILSSVGRALDDADRDLVLAAIRSVASIGATGKIFKNQLDHVARSTTDPEIAKAAAAASSRFP